MLLKVEDVSAGYGRIPVLNGISIEVGRGERVGLFGPNGHGKTTLLRTISGLMRPTHGRITFDGRDITTTAPKDIVSLGLIHVLQGNTLFPRMTVLENVLLGAYSKRAWDDREENLARIYELFPILKQRSRQLARTLSGGQRQMASIATGLMGMPVLLMLDEPTLGLAPKVKDELATAISEIAETGVTMILVDQDIELLLSVCERLYLVERGRVSLETRRGEKISQEDVLEMYFGKAASA
ncbi:MAG TPA: ABC transporter ATP-binding protein [Gaiellaceae bacterium]|nr:ABC transporter ATP-binding protein [Gaiellaceae bacterium]